MKVLVTGKNSFVGNYVGPYLIDKGHQVDYISLKDDRWLSQDFSNYEVILHVAGIAHVSYKSKDKDLYDQINHQLTKKVAIKAKDEGVTQFIFLSSMIVYHYKENAITEKTLPNPKGPYALSKLNAENALEELKSNDFNVAILRPSMIYGPGNKGNLPKLAKLIRFIRIFPMVYNKRSFLFVGNLAEAIHQVMKEKLNGILHLADQKPIATYDLVRYISSVRKDKILYLRVFNLPIRFFMRISIKLEKLFGDYYYQEDLIQHSFHYHLYDTEDAIKLSL